MRKTKFDTNSFYHVYNRGVDKRKIFTENKDYIKFLWSLTEFNNFLLHNQRTYLKNTFKEGGPNDVKQAIKNVNHQLLTNMSSYLDATEPEREKPPSSEASQLGGFSLSSRVSHPNYYSYLSSLPKLVDIICYALNPNHYHLLLKPLIKNGIQKFFHKLDMGYTLYFNKKYSRSGSLFQGKYKDVEIKTDEQLLYASSYINGNPEIHKISKAEKWQWSSYRDYLGLRSGTLCNKEIILKEFDSVKDYRKHTEDVIKYSREIKDDIKKYLLEENETK